MCVCSYECIVLSVCAGLLQMFSGPSASCQLLRPQNIYTHTLLLIKSPVPWWVTQWGCDGTHHIHTHSLSHTHTQSVCTVCLCSCFFYVFGCVGGDDPLVLPLKPCGPDSGGAGR